MTSRRGCHNFAWAADEHGFAVRAADGSVLLELARSWLMISGQSIATKHVIRVHVFDIGHHNEPYRGVELEVIGGTWIPVAVEQIYYFQGDVYTYDADAEHEELRELAADLASALGVPWDASESAGFLQTFSAALASPLPKLVGWDPSGTWCGIFAIEHNAARLLAQRFVAPFESLIEADVRARVADLRRARCHRRAPALWAIDDAGCTVWSRLFAIELDEQGAELRLPGMTVAKRDVVAVQSFTDGARHGVELALTGERYHVISAANIDDAAWATDLASALATRFDVPYRAVAPGGHKPALEKARAKSEEQLRELAAAMLDALDDPDQ